MKGVLVAYKRQLTLVAGTLLFALRTAILQAFHMRNIVHVGWMKILFDVLHNLLALNRGVWL